MFRLPNEMQSVRGKKIRAGPRVAHPPKTHFKKNLAWINGGAAAGELTPLSQPLIPNPSLQSALSGLIGVPLHRLTEINTGSPRSPAHQRATA